MRKDKKSVNILIISAHADDHLSCAGTVFKLQAEREMEAYEIILTDSSLGQDYRNTGHQERHQIKKLRSKELSEASRVLGIKQAFQFDEPDFGLYYSQELVFKVAKIIRQIKPQIVFLLGETDLHPDHKVAYKIGLEALKLASFGVSIKDLGQPFRVPVALCLDQEIPADVQVIVDITKYITKKEQLIDAYASQMSPKARAFEKGVLAVHGYHLSNEDEMAAEAFALQREFPVIGFSNSKTGLF